MKLSQLAARFPGSILETNGTDPEIEGVAPIRTARAGQLTFLHSVKYLADLKTTQASAVVLDLETPCPLPSIRTPNPRLLFARIVEEFDKPAPPPRGVHPTAVLGEGVTLGAGVGIGPGAVIGDHVELGDGVAVYPNAVLYAEVKVGARSVIHAGVIIAPRTEIGTDCVINPGAVIGAAGFGYELGPDGAWVAIPQIGHVVLEDGVEIGSLTAVDRPALGTTLIGKGTKIDNLVQIGHGCQIGPHCILVSQVGLAGGVTLGHHVILAGQTGVADHLTIGDGVMAGAKTGIAADIAADSKVMGYPAVANKDWFRMVIAERDLPELLRQVRRLEQRVAELESKAS